MQTILVIDDDRVTHSVIKRDLKGAFNLITSFEGEDGIKQSSEQLPDIILLDVEMPGLNGYEVCEIIKTNEETRHIPVIFLSSHKTLRERMQGFEAGADDFIVKPFQAEELKAKLNVVSRYRQTAEDLSLQIEVARETAYTALSGSSDLGQAIFFIERCHNVKTLEQMAREFFKVSTNLSLTCTLGIKSIDGEHFFSSRDNVVVPPLEAELITTLRNEENRFFDFGCRTQINYPHVSLLIKNMPLHDMDKYGRIKDLFPAMLSAADIKVTQLDTMISIQHQAEELNKSSQLITRALNKIKQSIEDNQKQSIKIMRDMLMELDKEVPRMGLDDDQEQYLLDRIDSAVSDAHENTAVTRELTVHFDLIIKNLEKQAEQQRLLAESLLEITEESDKDNEDGEGYTMDVELF